MVNGIDISPIPADKFADWDKDTGYQSQPLTPAEQARLVEAIGTQFLMHNRERSINDIYLRHLDEIIYAGGIAKNELKAEVEREIPTRGLAIRKINSGFFGWDSWYGLGALTAGQLNYWIDAGTPDNLGGSAGAEMKIGDPAVHCVLYLRDYAVSPSVETVEFTKNGAILPAIDTTEEFYASDLAVKELQNALYLVGGSKHDTFEARVYPGNGTVSYPALCGVSFLSLEAARIFDPSNMAGTTYNLIAVQ